MPMAYDKSDLLLFIVVLLCSYNYLFIYYRLCIVADRSKRMFWRAKSRVRSARVAGQNYFQRWRQDDEPATNYQTAPTISVTRLFLVAQDVQTRERVGCYSTSRLGTSGNPDTLTEPQTIGEYNRTRGVQTRRHRGSFAFSDTFETLADL